MDKAISEFLFATVPAVIVYFIGWAYLHIFLGAFGIYIAEISPDTPTIFIYAFSPLQSALKAGPIWLIAVILGIVIYVLIASNLVFGRLLSRLSAWTKIALLLILGTIFFLSVLPGVRWAALRQKAQVWDKKAEYVVPILANETLALDDPTLSLRESYLKCSEKQALLLIYANEKVYYLLCKSVENDKEGYVFEVRRESGLSSVRFVSSGE